MQAPCSNKLPLAAVGIVVLVLHRSEDRLCKKYIGDCIDVGGMVVESWVRQDCQPDALCSDVDGYRFATVLPTGMVVAVRWW